VNFQLPISNSQLGTNARPAGPESPKPSHPNGWARRPSGVVRATLRALLLIFGATIVALSPAASATAACKVTVAQQKFEGAERTVVTMENDRIVVDVVPVLEGRVSRYLDKARPTCPFEWVDDCPYHYGGRWEGKPFTYKIDEKGPDRAAVTVEGGGQVAVRLLRDLLGVDLTAPLELKARRTMSIDATSSRLRIDVTVTNVGASVAPQFRYMVHGVFGQVPPMKQGRAFWFLPTPRGVEFFDSARGDKEMWAASGAPVNHPFSRFIKGRRADKPRYEAGGWGALLTSAGPAYIYYDAKAYDFMQYWFGGDAEWHLTFEPHTKPVDLKPGESLSFGFTLAYDAADVPFDTPTVAYREPDVPGELTPGMTFPIEVRGTTVRGAPEKASVSVEVKGPAGKAIVARDVEGQVKPFEFSVFGVDCKIPDDAPLGKYTWSARAGGKPLGEGKIDVVSREQLEKLRIERLTAATRKKFEEDIQRVNQETDRLRRRERLWHEGVNLALGLSDAGDWPDTLAPAEATLTLRPRGIPVVGMWKTAEMPRISKLAPAPTRAWPEDPEKLLGALGAERADVRDVAAGAEPGELVALIVNADKKRVQVVRLAGGKVAVIKRFGDFAEQPGESDDKLGADARALAVDADGNIWVATNAWGKTSVFKTNQDGSPFEESVIGAKGAVKKFTRDGSRLAAVPLLATPMDLSLAAADGAPVVLASFRQVTSYHGAQVREGTMLLRVSDAARIGEIKAPAGSVTVDKSGAVWIADVAGHVASYDLKGHKLLDVSASPAPAVPDASLPTGSPLPVVLRAGSDAGVWALHTLARKLSAIDPKGEIAKDEKKPPESAGALYRFAVDTKGPVVVGTKETWRP
jgi:hypothetical protein